MAKTAKGKAKSTATVPVQSITTTTTTIPKSRSSKKDVVSVSKTVVVLEEPSTSNGAVEDVEEDVVEDEEIESDSDDDDEEVDEETMQKLMGLLGDIDPAELGLDAMDDEDDEDEEEGESDADEEVAGIQDELSAILEGASGAVEDEEDEEEDDEDFENGLDEELSEDEEEELSEIFENDKVAKKAKGPARDPVQDAILDKILARFKIDAPFFETLVLTYPEPLDIEDAENDLQRELVFYKQSLWAAQHAYKLFKAASAPFTRPSDYYAEMLKSDEHMERIRKKLQEEKLSIEASEKAKKQRQLKKFGKSMQNEKLKEREMVKKNFNDKVGEFKKKRKLNAGGGADGGQKEEFDVEAVNEMSSSRAHKRARNEINANGGKRGGDNNDRKNRAGKDKKYGFGGASNNRRAKQNDKASSDNIFGAAGRGGKAAMRSAGKGGKKSKQTRLGKSKRK